MKVIIAYLCVVLVWSTTPLAVVWSNSSLSFMAAGTARMVFAFAVSLIVLYASGRRLFVQAKDWKVYVAGGLALYPNMILVYWSAQHIPSGLISVIFGMSPFVVGLFSIILLKVNPFTPARVLALVIASLGLGLIHAEQFAVGEKAVLGVAGIVVSSFIFAFSIVLLKRLGGGIEPIRQLSGTLLFAAPCFLLTWFLVDGTVPPNIDFRSIIGVSYLVIMGSIIGGMAFYYVLAHCQVSSVALIPLLTPVNALILGFVVEGDVLNTSALIGSALILISLGIYQNMIKPVLIRIRRLIGQKSAATLSVRELLARR